MRITKKTNNDERLILTAMIVDRTVLGRISSKWTGQMFKSRYANIIANWCIKFYSKYEKAPMKHIEHLFDSWSSQQKDKDTVNLVERFLSSLNSEYKKLRKASNSDYVIDTVGRYFNQVQVEHLLSTTQTDIDEGKSDKALEKIAAFRQVEMGVGEGIDILQDKEAIQAAFEDKKEPLITYPGALGEFFKDNLERDGFVAFMGPEKRGKSFWLLDVAWRAMLQRRRVAFFEAGDNSEHQVIRRLMVRASKRPLRAASIKMPTRLIKIKQSSKRSRYISRFKTKTFKNKLSWQKSLKACRKIMRERVKSQESYFRLSCHFNSTLSVDSIQNILQEWERDGWTADVIVIDYADILKMDYPGLEGRDRINETWKRLRGLSQKYHCLVVTATQADAASYSVKTVNMANFSDDKRKFSHVTGTVGINQTPVEKEKSIMRLNWVVLRESDFNIRRCVYAAGCLAVSNPAIKSCF